MAGRAADTARAYPRRSTRRTDHLHSSQSPRPRRPRHVIFHDLGALRPDHPYADVANVILRAEAAAAMEELMERGDLAKLTAPEDRINGFAGAFIVSARLRES